VTTTDACTTTCVLSQILNAKALNEILSEDAPVEEIVDQLFAKGSQLAETVTVMKYSGWKEFCNQHTEAHGELAQLEGASNIDEGNIVVLLQCPMADEMKKLQEDGKPPAHHQNITDTYMVQNPGSNALLHPGCIAHQVARQLIVKQLQVTGKKNINYYQLACRSMATGKVVYDENGLARMGMTREQADKLVDGHACLYVMVVE
jgi:hypothetical protein